MRRCRAPSPPTARVTSTSWRSCPAATSSGRTPRVSIPPSRGRCASARRRRPSSVRLDPGATVEGRVVDERAQPVAGADVAVSGESLDGTPIAMTASSGAARWPAPTSSRRASSASCAGRCRFRRCRRSARRRRRPSGSAPTTRAPFASPGCRPDAWWSSPRTRNSRAAPPSRCASWPAPSCA